MTLAQRLAELETELSIKKMAFTELGADIRGIETQIVVIRTSVEGKSDLSTLPRTEAILSVLRAAEGTLGPTDIKRSLQAAGRDENLHIVTSTLHYLRKTGRVTTPDRGRYLTV